MDEDFMVALQLQEQFDNEYESSLLSPTNFVENSVEQSSKKRKIESGGNGIPWTNRVERPMSIVDESWEILDPSPDVRAMFLEFNAMFFEGKLSGVEVKWSPRMTLCAGVCSYEGRGGLCSIRLSEPLLKLRPRRDLVQTLLHEMIHALLFVTQNNRDRDGHGPEFCKHMERINTATGTKITVYHSFTDEVDLYRQHWWKCDGPCQHRKPYFGFVKRAMNRAPSANDPWWGDHQRTCGGTYNKVKEPEGYGKKKGKAESGKAQSGKDKMAEGKKPVGNAKPSSTTTASSRSQDIRDMIPFSGKGVLLGGSQPSSSPKSPEPVWKRPFPSPVSSPKRPPFSPPPRNKLGSPTDAFLDSLGKNSSGTLPLNKPPTKRSVGNTKYFVSINGSPVRVPKPNRGNVGPGSAKQHTPGGHILNAKQKSVKELFDSFSITESTKPLTDSNGKTPSSTRQQVNPPSSLSKYPSGAPTMSKPSPTKPSQSKYFGSQGAAGAASVSAVPSRKRSWDERGGTPNLLDFFSKKAGGSGLPQGQERVTGSGASAASGSSGEHQKTATATVTSSTAPNSSSHFPSSSAASSSSTALPNTSSSSSVPLPLMVSCPVCQVKVQESKINEHLDSCLC
ncbi:DNA-dependent metalloprotease SPRTN [Gadus chalcogrammus]|uniref:DNA-dependent metalloprotease SPRTN n=1 Tax=Gadus chalcogrammus TaxID=1042646 RepID=UPI0024C4D08F|nr:DNA-dependent metalloprotease SPRTN [Gadus chalcogrammus]